MTQNPEAFRALLTCRDHEANQGAKQQTQGCLRHHCFSFWKEIIKGAAGCQVWPKLWAAIYVEIAQNRRAKCHVACKSILNKLCLAALVKLKVT